MSGDRLIRQYEAFYRDRDPIHVYPVEFVVRAFLGNYPRHRTNPASHRGRRVLDLGFGDGRNMPFLSNLGMQVFGVEISQDICDRTHRRMQRLGIPVETSVGRNRSIPYKDSFFDAILACHALYYVDPGSQFSDNVIEIARVLRPGGTLVCSTPIGTSYLLRGAQDLGNGHMEIANDPYGVRNGSIVKKFDSQGEIEAELMPRFCDFRIGSCRNDFWGVEEDVWIVVCRKNVVMAGGDQSI